MKLRLLFLLILVANLGLAQSSTKEVYKALEGSWVKQKVSWAVEAQQGELAAFQKHYLRYEFTPKREMLAYGTYFANGVKVEHTLNKRRLKFGFGREFSIDTIEEDRLVLVELDAGKVGPNSVRFEYVREHLRLETLPVDPATRLIKADGDTIYFDSEKFHPKFQVKKYPDFHLYVHNQIKRYYPYGENYFYASFEIDGAGVIDNIRVFGHTNQKSTEKSKEVIKSSEGRWLLPKLNGKGGKVLVTITDRFEKRRSSGTFSISANGSDVTQKYNDAYVNAHQKAVRKYFKRAYDEALELLALCEQMRPNEPNMIYLKYLVYKQREDEKAVEEQGARLLETPLSFLIK